MDLNTHYILNPNYLVFNDINRCYLTTVHEFRYNYTVDFFQNSCQFIHPLQAQMLSFFDGQENLRTTLNKIANHFGLSEEEVCTLITPYLENQEDFAIKTGEHWIGFPKQMLVKKQNMERHRYYTPDDFPFSGTVEMKQKRLNIPRYYLFVLNTDCYTDCQYCYADKKYKYTNKLSADRVIELIDEIQSLGGAVNIDINGGELPLHTENLKVIQHIVSLKYDPLVSTKMPLNPKQVERIADTGLKRIQVSLDSPNSDVISRLLKVKQADYYQRMLDMLAEFDRHEITILIHPVLTRLNSNIPDIEKLLNDILIFPHLKIIHFTPAGYSLFKGDDAYEKLKPSIDALNEIKAFIQPYAKQHPDRSIFVGDHRFIKSNFEDSIKKQALFETRTYCSGNQKSMIVMPDGKTTVCEEMYWHPRFILGDLSRQSILEAWNSDKAWELYNLSQADFSDKSACKTCSQFQTCRGVGKDICWKHVQYFYGRENWDFPEPSCPYAPAAYHNCMI